MGGLFPTPKDSTKDRFCLCRINSKWQENWILIAGVQNSSEKGVALPEATQQLNQR